MDISMPGVCLTNPILELEHVFEDREPTRQIVV